MPTSTSSILSLEPPSVYPGTVTGTTRASSKSHILSIIMATARWLSGSLDKPSPHSYAIYSVSVLSRLLVGLLHFSLTFGIFHPMVSHSRHNTIESSPIWSQRTHILVCSFFFFPFFSLFGSNPFDLLLSHHASCMGANHFNIDDAGINATRVVSGRRFVRWDAVPKLLSQQNRYISGLPYDFFFSKAISPISMTTNNASAATPTTIVASASTPTPSRKRHSYHNSDSDTYSNEMAPPLVPSSSETDASYGINPDTDLDTEMELSMDVLNQADKDSLEVTRDSMTAPPPYVLSHSLFISHLNAPLRFFLNTERVRVEVASRASLLTFKLQPPRLKQSSHNCMRSH